MIIKSCAIFVLQKQNSSIISFKMPKMLIKTSNGLILKRFKLSKFKNFLDNTAKCICKKLNHKVMIKWINKYIKIWNKTTTRIKMLPMIKVCEFSCLGTVLSTNQQSGVNRKTEIYFRLMACLADSDNPLTVQSPGNGQQQTLNNNVYWRQ